MKMTALFLFPIALGLLSACNDDAAVNANASTEELKTVEWYLANDDARIAKALECSGYGHDESLENTPNCINAWAAVEKKLKERDAQIEQQYGVK
ncbi:hypothetical protein AGMMS49545_14840 [Betaproteobacteria bacterium]|nr:hypothetical protein AGMMS49545_14840 [Betaproteobacteria bacterium]GHU49319.1 hypothetical protein AGMMS50289_26360 [Betaproteobacteria bacterium]